MSSKTSKLLKFFMILVCVVLAFSIVACSERNNSNENPVNPSDPSKPEPTPSVTLSKTEAFARIKESMTFLDQELYDDPEWLCIDTFIEFDFHSYEKEGGLYTKKAKKTAEYSLRIKANISLKDNSQSVVLLHDVSRFRSELKILRGRNKYHHRRTKTRFSP